MTKRCGICAVAGLLALGSVDASALAEPVRLICEGTWTQPPPKPINAKVGPGATIIDLANKSLATPAGLFSITSATEEAIFFDDPRPGKLKVWGKMDRLTGDAIIFERTEEQEAAMRAGRKSIAAVTIELHCVPAKPLF